MYLKKVIFENVGPIRDLSMLLPFDGERPIPLVLVGPNGSGKSIFLSFVANFYLSLQSIAFENSEVEKGKVFKTRSARYVAHGSNHYYAKLSFENDFEYVEMHLDRNKDKFQTDLGYCPLHKREWNTIQPSGNDLVKLPTLGEDSERARKLFSDFCCQYFPANRYEAPAWLNRREVVSEANFSNPENFSSRTDRRIINTGSLAEIKDWLLDLHFDARVLKSKNINDTFVQIDPGSVEFRIIARINDFVAKLYPSRHENSRHRFGIGFRGSRTIAVVRDEGRESQTLIPDIFQLSTGEVAALNLFCSIVRDYDLATRSFGSIEDIRGIALVDEIDSHMHARMLTDILPLVFKLLPKVQFVVTSHSPMFLLGLKNHLGPNGFRIVELPSGDAISPEDFSEFGEAFKVFSKTSRFGSELKEYVKRTLRPIVLCEGETDPLFLRKAALVLGKADLLERVQIDWVGSKLPSGQAYNTGQSALEHAQTFFEANPDLILRPLMLLFDFDAKKVDQDLGRLFIRSTRENENNKRIKKGIENLFPDSLFRAEFYQETVKIGSYGEKKSIESFQKTGFCEHVCNNTKIDPEKEKADFANFSPLLDMIEAFAAQSK